MFIVGRPIECEPAAALQLQQQAVGFGIRGIHDPDISVLAGAAGGAVGEAVVVIGEAGAEVARFAVGQQRNVARSEIVAVELEPLAAADIFGEDEVIAIRSVVSAGDAIRKECKLGARSARHFDEVHLWHVGKAGGNEHFAPCRVPILEAAELAILVSLLSDRRRNGRNVFHHQVVARSNDCWLGGRVLRNSGGSEQQKNEDYRVAPHIDLHGSAKRNCADWVTSS